MSGTVVLIAVCACVGVNDATFDVGSIWGTGLAWDNTRLFTCVMVTEGEVVVSLVFFKSLLGVTTSCGLLEEPTSTWVVTTVPDDVL